MNNFVENGYCVIRSAITDELRDFITQYALFDEMQDYTPDGFQVPDAHAKYADPAMETLLVNLQPLIEKNTGLSLYPTYSFFRIYRDGDDLAEHIDRESCEISATLCFNYSYDDATFTWPIYMGNTEIDLKPGDLAIYRGCDLRHSRKKLQSPTGDSWHVQGFFHYVDANGPFADFKNDKRTSIGSLKKTIAKTNFGKSYIQYVNKS